MKSVTVCITNYQSGEAVQLAIESVRRYTSRPFSISVYDDASDPVHYGDELTYLRDARDKGWIRLIEGAKRIGHNGALPALLDSVTDDLAMVIDCDIQITGPGWLDEMIECQESKSAAIIVDLESFPDNPAVIDSWFFMLDMKQYPEFEATWEYTQRPDFVSWEQTPDALYATGFRVWERAVTQGRVIVPVPVSVRHKFRHFGHVSVLSWPPDCPEFAVRTGRMAVIGAELAKLRASA